MNELGEFFITFNTKGLQEVKDGLKDINTKMDGLNSAFTQGISVGDNFFGKFTAWGLKITALVAGFVSIGKAMKDAFNIGKDITQLNVLADVAGVRAEDVEALAIALAPYKAGQKDISSAANFYRQMTETQTQWWRGQYSEKVIEEMSRAGVTGLKANSTQEQWMNGLVDALSYYQGQHTRQAIGARNLFAKAFGLSDEQMLFFAEGRDYVSKQLEYGRQHITLAGEANLRNAAEQTRAKMEFQEAWDNLTKRLMPLVTDFLNALTWLVNGITAVVDWIKEKLGLPYEYTKDIINGKITSTDATLALTDGLEDIANDDSQPRWKRKLAEAFGGLTKAVTGEVARRNNKTEEEQIAEANPRLIAAGKNPLITRANSALANTRNGLNTAPSNVNNTTTRNNTANFGNIYVTGAENVGRVVRGQLNAAVNSMGDK